MRLSADGLPDSVKELASIVVNGRDLRSRAIGSRLAVLRSCPARIAPPVALPAQNFTSTRFRRTKTGTMLWRASSV